MAVAFATALLVGGCDLTHTPILDPKGPIALAERNLLLTAVVLMLIVIIPVFVMTVLFAWRYRSSNGNARYTPDWSYSARVDAVVWLVPVVIVVALGALLWSNTHKLDPYRRIDATVPELEVQAVAQDWKWLFIYPAQGIAAVNQLVFPAGVPDTGVLGVVADTGSGIWMGTLRDGLWNVTGSTARHYASPSPPIDPRVRPLFQASDGTLWVWGDRLEALRGERWSPFLASALRTLSQEFPLSESEAEGEGARHCVPALGATHRGRR